MSELRATSLNKRYRSRTVVHDVSISMRSGEVVGLLGPNGAGKTTCFYMIVGLVAADGGDIFIDDLKITHLPIHRRANLGLGYLPQEGKSQNFWSIAQANGFDFYSSKSNTKKAEMFKKYEHYTEKAVA